jgi:UDP-N-acetylglucosamine transferase subunit ALG13
VQGFDRLLQLVDDAAGRGLLPGPVKVQRGQSQFLPTSDNVSTVDFLSPSELQCELQSAEYVVCHAGSGIIAGALRAGRRPLVLARLKEHAEHVDDHQLQIVDRLAALQLVVPLSKEITEKELEAAKQPITPIQPGLGKSLPKIESVLQRILARGAEGPDVEIVSDQP